MSAFAGKLKTAYTARALRAVEVPEWDMVLYVGAMTVGQASRFSAETDDFKRACRIIQVRAKKQDGSPLFDEEDFDAMVSHGVADVIAGVAREIMNGDPDPEEQGKN